MAAIDFGTLAARLSSFEASVKLSRKTVKWSCDAPSPAELAAAGFFWKPSASSHDNTVCFLCERALDNWEKDDLPLTEHLKHSPDCGWAIVKSLGEAGFDPTTMEDPTDTRLSEARRATFMSRWPHEDKRGWLCKTERLVQAGWFYAPTPESDDYVSCAYCKLSLDGFEPKDNPFDEHYRRSPGCPFFTFAGTTAPKAANGRKSRTSKASRLSTQSTMTSASEVSTIPDLDESIDASTLSINTLASSTSAVSNKSIKSKGRSARESKVQAVELIVVKPATIGENLQANTKVARGTKRTSDSISEDERGYRESTVKPEPPMKRRNTRTRGSVIEQVEYPVLQVEPESMDVEPVPRKAAQGGKKRASSRSRKTSAASTASLRAGVPDNATIEAELEADLDRPMSDEDKPVVVDEMPKKRGRKPKGTGASTAPTRGQGAASVEREVPGSETEAQLVESSELQLTYNTDVKGPTRSRSMSTKIKGSKKNTTKPPKRTNRDSEELIATAVTEFESQPDNSTITSQTEADDSGHETDASVGGKSIIRKGSKRKPSTKDRGKKGGSSAMSKNIEDIVQSQPQAQTISAAMGPAEGEPALGTNTAKDVETMNIDSQVAPPAANIVESSMLDDQASKRPIRTAPKSGKPKLTRTKKPKAADKQPQLSMPGAFSPPMPDQEHDIEPSVASVLSPTSPPVVAGSINNIDVAASLQLTSPNVPVLRPQLPPRSPLRNMNSSARPTLTPQRNDIPRGQKETTPSPSPQSSNAENAPPSTRPPSTRPPLAPLSPAKNQIMRVAFAPGTPRAVPLSPSKIGGGLRSDTPWTSLDVEMVFTTATPSGEKENLSVPHTLAGDLTSPEKKMTVEEWIHWNARKAEEELRTESERVLGIFEKEGGRALRVLEGIEVSD